MGMNMNDMTASLVGLDEDTRRAMLQSRLEGFASMPTTERLAAMTAMLNATQTLSDDDHRTLVVSRTWALSQLPHDTQVTLIRSHMASLGQLDSESRQREMTAMQFGIQSLSDDAMRDLTQSMKEA